MPAKKVTIIGRVVRIYPGYRNDSGRHIRTIDIREFDDNRAQNYRLTEVEENPRKLIEGEYYEFECFLNGIRRGGRNENNLLISKTYSLDAQKA